MSVVPLTSAQDDKQNRTFSVGILIALASWSVMFLTLFWGYLVYRWRTNVWLEEYVSGSLLTLAVVNTVVIVASGIFLRAVFRDQRSDIKVQLFTAGFWMCGVWFLIGQVLLWRGFIRNGLTFRESVAGNFFFLLTGFHAVHIIGALIAAAVVSMPRVSGASSSNTVKGVQYFWDFLTVMWGIMFVVIFIVK